MNTIDYLNSKIKNSASVIQFAKDGKYEDAWIVSIDQKRPSIEDIESYIQKGEYKELIVEYIWNPTDDADRYVLTVVQNKQCIEQNRKTFVSTCLDLFYQQLSFEKIVQQLDQLIVGNPFLLQQSVQRVRLGVFNHWFSVGPIELWNAGDEIQKEDIAMKIQNRPEVYRSKLNYQGLAFIYNFDGTLPGPYHVLKTPTCKKQGDEWVVDIDLVYNTMLFMLGNKKQN